MIDGAWLDLTETTEDEDTREEFPQLKNRKMDDYPTELAIADAERLYKDFPKMTLVINDGKSELMHASVKVSWSFNKETLVQEKIPEYVVVVVGSNLANMMESTHTHRCNRVMFKASDGEGYVRIPKSGTSHVVAFAVTSENIAKKLTSREKYYYEAYINDYYPYGIMSWHTACLCSWAQTTIYAPQTLFAQLPQTGWRKMLWDFTYEGDHTIFRKPNDQCNFRRDTIITIPYKCTINLFVTIMFVISISMLLCGLIIGSILASAVGICAYLVGWGAEFATISMSDDNSIVGFGLTLNEEYFMTSYENDESRSPLGPRRHLHPGFTAFLVVMGLLNTGSLHDTFSPSSNAINFFTALSMTLFLSFHIPWWMVGVDDSKYAWIERHGKAIHYWKIASALSVGCLVLTLIPDSGIISNYLSPKLQSAYEYIYFSAIALTTSFALMKIIQFIGKKYSAKQQHKAHDYEDALKTKIEIAQTPIRPSYQHAVAYEGVSDVMTTPLIKSTTKHRLYMRFHAVKQEVCLPFEDA